MSNEINIISIENLYAGYNGKHVLNGLNLFLQKNEICCVIGEEGAGKSTLLRAITHQLKSKGGIIFKGINLGKVQTAQMLKHGIDFIVQGGNILKSFTVEEHICLALSARSEAEKSIVWKEIEQTFPKMIALKKQVAGRLSGGERMILSIVCVMATDADFIVMDEPTAGLAPETCKVIKEFLLQMKEKRDKTILLIEHNYDFAFEVADSVVTLKGGTLSEKYYKDSFHQPDFVDTKLYETAISLTQKINKDEK